MQDDPKLLARLRALKAAGASDDEMRRYVDEYERTQGGGSIADVVPQPHGAPAEPPKKRSGLIGAGLSVGQGAAGGFLDEAADFIARGGINPMSAPGVIARAIRGERLGEGKAGSWIRENQEAFSEQNPKLAFGLEVAGGAAAGAGLAGARVASSVLRPTVKRLAAEGAGFGGLAGFGSAEGGVVDRLPQAAASAALGGVLTPAVARGAPAVTNVVKRMAGKAEPAVPRATRGAGNALLARTDDLAGQIERAPGDDGRLIVNILPEEAKKLADAAQKLAAPGSAKLTSALQSQGDEIVDRAGNAVGKAGPLGKVSVVDRLAEISARQKAKAGPLYKQVDEFGAIVDDEITELLNTPAGKAGLKDASTIALNNRQPLGFVNEAGEMVRAPTLRELDHLKKSLDVAGSYDPKASPIERARAQSVAKVRDDLVTRLDKLAPVYGKARSEWGGEQALKDALEEGREAFTRSAGENAEELSARIAKLSPSQREAFREGFLQRMRDLVADDAGEIPNAWKRLQGSKGMRDKLALVMQDAPEAHKELTEALMRSKDIRTDLVRFLKGSQTAERMSAIRDLLGEDLSVGDFMSPKTTAIKMAVNMLNRRRQLGNKKVASEFAELVSPRLGTPEALEAAQRLRRVVQFNQRGQVAKGAGRGTAVGAADRR